MKKKLLLLCTFLISFIIYVDSVEAAQKLTCVYKEEIKYIGKEDTRHVYMKMIKQTSDGVIHYYNVDNEGANEHSIISNPEYYFKELDGQANTNINKYLKNKDLETLEECPICLTSDLGPTKLKRFKFSDKEKCNHPLLDDEEIAKNSILNSDSIDDLKTCVEVKYTEKNRNFNCEYENSDYKITLSYNNENSINPHEFFLKTEKDGKQITTYSCFSYNNLMEKNSKGCPRFIYYKKESKNAVNIFLEKLENNNIEAIPRTFHENYDDNGNIITKEKSDATISSDYKPNNCGELISDDLQDEIDNVMTIIRIIVPILLLVFGIIDFFKATFSGSEDEMIKSKKNFMKRILAAVIVFIVPLFVNLVLNVANMVWDDIKSDTCISNE